jgi:hypothetical protein
LKLRVELRDEIVKGGEEGGITVEGLEPAGALHVDGMSQVRRYLYPVVSHV